jgi:type IV pilus assembly protein PilY1
VIGGGKLLIPGLELQGGGNLNLDDAIWRRRSWRELNNDL